MCSLDYCYITIFACVVYLIKLLSCRNYRLLLPSVVHSITWLITMLLLACQLTGWGVSEKIIDADVIRSSEYICYLVIASVLGFSIAHSLVNITYIRKRTKLIANVEIENILRRFRWIPYVCFILGIILYIYIIRTIGVYGTFGEFRDLAVNIKWNGPFEMIKRLSGHINILSFFYLILLGYSHGQKGINLKTTLKYIILCSTINMSIGGRLWLITSTLPYIIAYIYSLNFTDNIDSHFKKDYKKIFVLVAIVSATFSFMGIARDDREVEKGVIDKFLYFTDGTRMSNMILNQYPPGSYELEYGKSEFLGQFISSPMSIKFKESISDNAGLLVTVRSSIASLYYDFGFYGGIIMWMIYCIILEFFAIKLISTQKVLGILMQVLLSMMLFLSPIFEVFAVYIPYFEWLLLLYIFRYKVFSPIVKRQYI